MTSKDELIEELLQSLEEICEALGHTYDDVRIRHGDVRLQLTWRAAKELIYESRGALL